MRKIQISESKLYEIIKQVLLEQKERRIIKFSPSEFKSFILTKKYQKFVNVLNANYDEVIVNGYLDLSNTPITSLPNNLVVNGSLFLSNTQITSLPDDFKVNSNLNLMNTPITSLPNNLKVGNNLYLENTLIESLPNNLKVGEDIYIYNTPLSKNDELINQYINKYSIFTHISFLQQEELGEQSTEDAKTAYPAVTKWETGIKRGPANPINPKQKWSDTYQTKRGKANTIDPKSKWSTGLTRGKANTLL